MIKFNIYLHTWRLNPGNSGPRHKSYQLYYDYNHTYLQCREKILPHNKKGNAKSIIIND